MSPKIQKYTWLLNLTADAFITHNSTPKCVMSYAYAFPFYFYYESLNSEKKSINVDFWCEWLQRTTVFVTWIKWNSINLTTWFESDDAIPINEINALIDFGHVQIEDVVFNWNTSEILFEKSLKKFVKRRSWHLISSTSHKKKCKT